MRIKQKKNYNFITNSVFNNITLFKKVRDCWK